MIAALRRLITGKAPHVHAWQVIYTDDSTCHCGALRYWPSGDVVEVSEMDATTRSWVLSTI